MSETLDQERAESEPPLFPLKRTCPFHPPAEYAGLRDEKPVSKVRLAVSGKVFWIVTRQDQVRRVLTATTTSSNFKNPAYPLQVPVPEEALQAMELPLVAMDPPEHTVRRHAIIPELTMKRMQALRPRIQEIVDEHIDAMLERGGPVDLVQALAVPVPSLIFCELMGVPKPEIASFRSFAETTVKSDVSPEEFGAAMQQMEAYLDKLVAEKEQHPTDDLLGRVIQRGSEGGELGHSDFVALARNLIFGGFDTVANMISLGTALLLEHPAQLAEITADFSLLPNAIEEMLRFLSIADSATARAITEDIEIDGVLIRAGEGVIALNGSANRDDRVFENPDVFDIHREIPLHSAFGHGIHQCPGANLVRIELDVVFRTLFTRIPELRLAVPMEDVPFKEMTLIQGLKELPVTW
jgi:cytochrome P450